MSKKLGKLGLLCLEGTAVTIALLAGVAAFAHWKVSHGGLPLNILKPVVIASIEERLAEGRTISVGSMVLKRETQEGEEGGPLHLLTENLVVTGETGNTILQFPELTFELSTQDLLRGSIRPRYVEISDAAISVTRTQAGVFDLGFSANGDGGDSNLLAGILGGDIATDITAEKGSAKTRNALFEGASLSGLNFEFIDELSGNVWQAEKADARLAKVEGGYRATLNAPFSLDGRMVDLKLAASLDDLAQEVRIYLDTDKAPVSELLELVAGAEIAERVTAEVSGNVEAVIDFAGAMKRARVAINAREGAVEIGDKEIPFSSVALEADYDPIKRRFDIADFSYDIIGNTGTLAGFVSFGGLTEDATLNPEQIEFSLLASDLLINLPDALPEPLPIEAAIVAGLYDLTESTLSLSEAKATYFGEEISGTATLLLPEEAGQSPGVIAQAEISGDLSPEEILRGWPKSVATGVRDWVEGNLPKGVASDVDFTMDMPRGAIQPGTPLKDEYMRLTFSVADATAFYVPGMTPLNNVGGRGVVTGNSFNLKTIGGRIGGVQILSGEVDMPAFYPRRGPGYYRAKIKGDIREVLSIIDEEPLRFIQKGGFTPDDFAGEGEFSFDIMRPMRSVAPLELYRFNGSGRFSGLSVENVIEGYELADGEGELSLSTTGMDVKGTAALEDAPISFVWRRQFDESEKTEISATGTVDTFVADNFGFSLRQFLRGKVGYDVNLLQEQGNYKSARLQLDLGEAELSVDQIDWTKARGTAGILDVSVQFPDKQNPDSYWDFDRVRLDTDSMVVSADASLTQRGSFLQASLDRLYVEDRADLKAKLTRENDTLNIDVTGAFANLDIFSSLLKSDNPEAGQGTIPGKTQLNINLGRFDMRDGISLDDFDARLSHNGAQITSATVAGAINEGGSLNLALKQSDEKEIGRKLDVFTDNLGSILRGFLGVTSVEGGVAAYEASELTNGPFAGTLTAGDFRVADTPLLARIFSAGSLTGLNDLLSGDGIEIVSVAADLQFDEGVLSIVDARATGPSIGVSVAGDVDFVLDNFDINGAFAPAYQVNSALGQLPGIGDLLISRRGEGVVAFSYGVDGPVNEPTVTVNALSLLTPGIFRRVFEPARISKKSTAELLEEAVQAAELSRQRDVTATAEQLQELEENIGNIGLPAQPDTGELNASEPDTGEGVQNPSPPENRLN